MTEPIQLLTYTMTTEDMPDPCIDKLPPKDQRFLLVLQKAAFGSNFKAIPKLEEFIQKYPFIRKAYSYLYYLLIKNGNEERSLEIMKEMYSKFPDYLFARLYVVQENMRDNKNAFIEEFGEKYDLKLVYPERTEFHISELSAFWNILLMHYFENDMEDELKNLTHAIEKINESYDGYFDDVLDAYNSEKYMIKKIMKSLGNLIEDN